MWDWFKSSMTYFSLRCRRSWSFKFPRLEKDFVQCLHLYGFDPVWILSWTCILNFSLNLLPHVPHAYPNACFSRVRAFFLKHFRRVSSFKPSSVVWWSSHLPKDYILLMRSTSIDELPKLIFENLLILVPFYIVWSKGC